MSSTTQPAPRRWYARLWDAACAFEQHAFRQFPAALLIVMVWGLAFAGSPADSYWSTRDLRARGHTVNVSRVQVYVSRDACRSPRCVTDVRVQMPGRPGWVLLREPDTPTAVNDDAATGWQPATADTGYSAPLRVLVADQADGRVEAMAVRDAEYAMSPDGVGWFTAGVLVLMLTLVVAVVWVRRFAALPAPRVKAWKQLRQS